MSADASHADETRAFHAPDGITILPFTMPGLAHLSFVEGRIPPRPEPYPIHLHGALEQVTYVLAGRITVTTWDAGKESPTAFEAIAGDAFVTLPLQTLAFANTGSAEARVLFICAPPYPPDDSDTRLVTAHHAPTAEEIAWSLGRRQAAMDAFAAITVVARQGLVRERATGQRHARCRRWIGALRARPRERRIGASGR